MNLKNAGVLIMVMVVQILCLGVFSTWILEPIITTSINKETTKIEHNLSSSISNDIKTEIDNKFKKIESLNSNLETILPLVNDQKPTQQNSTNIEKLIPENYFLVHKNRVRRLRKENEKTGKKVFH